MDDCKNDLIICVPLKNNSKQINKKINDTQQKINKLLHEKYELYPDILYNILYSKNIDEFTDEEMNFVLEQQKNVQINQCNSSSKNNFVLEEKEMKNIKDFCLKCVKEYFYDCFKVDDKTQIHITQSWLNLNSKGEYANIHVHPNSIFSGVFYFNADPETDKLYFTSGKYLQITINPSHCDLLNSRTWWFPAETGKLLIFPSDLQHFVETVQTDEDRISLAFNVFIRGTIGAEHSLDMLVLQ